MRGTRGRRGWRLEAVTGRRRSIGCWRSGLSVGWPLLAREMAGVLEGCSLIKHRETIGKEKLFYWSEFSNGDGDLEGG